MEWIEETFFTKFPYAFQLSTVEFKTINSDQLPNDTLLSIASMRIYFTSKEKALQWKMQYFPTKE